MSRRAWIGLIAGLLLAFAIAIAALRLRDDGLTAGQAYTLAKVERGDLIYSVSATGTLKPLITVQVGTQVSGTIEAVHVDFNSEVEKGQVVAQIDAALFRAQVAQARANHDSAKAGLEKAWVTAADAKRQLERAKGLQRRSMMAESEVDTAQFNYDAAMVETRVRQAAVAQAAAVLEHSKVNLANTTIYAPIDGVVLSKNVDVGQTVAASLQAPTLFTIAQDLRRMRIETDVDEAFIGLIHEGQPVSFSVFAYPREVFDGTLAQIRLSPQLREDSDVVLYNCIIEVDNAALKLKPGMTATVTIDVAERHDVLKVPNAALRYVPDLPLEQLKALRQQVDFENDEALIWTPTPGGAKPVKVTLGLTSDYQTEISAAEIAEGAEIILAEQSERAAPQRSTGIRLF